jgi:hypothetical protein
VAGGIPLAEDYPFLNKYRISIPLNNSMVLNGLLNELAKLVSRKGSIELMLQNSKLRLIVPIPKGIGKSTLRKFNTAIHRAIAWASSGSVDEAAVVAKSLIDTLCTEYEDKFVEVASENGLWTNKSKIMGPVFWTAMCEDCNFDISTQRQLNMYLKYHFGTRVTVSETIIREQVGNDYIPFTTFEKKIDGKRILYSYRDIDTMLTHAINTALALRDLDDIAHAELALGGDHGKGAFTFLAVLFLRYTNGKKVSIFEMQVGQINSASDSAEILKPLIEKLEESIRRIDPDANGNSKLVVTNTTADDEKKQRSVFFQSNNPLDNNIILDTELRFFLIGDLKFLFTMLGQDGYSGSWCLYCLLKQSNWTAIHGDNKNGKCDCEAAPWTIDNLHGAAMKQMQNEVNNAPYISVGIREPPLWSFIPVHRVLIPMLYLLLGLGNNILDNFWEWVDERVEKLTPEEIEARNMSMLAKITLDDENENLTDATIDLEFLVLERQRLNDELKPRGLARQEKERLTIAK